MIELEGGVIVIFGATGDLTKRKLMPALCHLSKNGSFPESLVIIGVDRAPISNSDFRALMHSAIEGIDDQHWADFEKRLNYFPCDLKDSSSYSGLSAKIKELNNGSLSNRLFYCATPPTLVASIVGGINSAGLSSEAEGWSRIIVEKPFGRSLASSETLSEAIAKTFHEHQIYRIDHYLGKETVQNILVFRFGNALFEPVWNHNHIDYIEITAAETLGVGHRGGYYEEAGALRDMVTNHLMQLLALVAMEPPIAFDADSVRDKRTDVWRAIKPMTPEEVAVKTVRGQYTEGNIQGEQVQGYKEESSVKNDSVTETYIAAEFRIENWRWAGVPFYLRTGKRLASGVTEIAVHFKSAPQPMFSKSVEHNVITFYIHPDEGIDISFNAKQPGSEMKPANVSMDFRYHWTFDSRIPEAYEALLLDALHGDATLFTRRDGVEAQWKIIDPILDAWSQQTEISNYASGSEGPSSADDLLKRNGHKWRLLNTKIV